MASDPNRDLYGPSEGISLTPLKVTNDCSPLKVRGPLRYVFTEEGSHSQRVIKNATDDLGFAVEPAIEWTELWPSLQGSFANAADRFVPTIENAVTAVVESVHAVASEDEDFADKLIGAVQKQNPGSGSRLNKRAMFVFAEARNDLPSWLPQVAWEATPKRRGMVIYVPSSSGLRLNETTAGLMRQSVQSMFEEKEDADVMVPRIGPIAPIMTTAAESSAAPIVGVPTKLPTLQDLPAPSVILSSTAPYLARVSRLADRILVECTHEPVLILLSGYLERWSRKNPNDSQNVPFARVELKESVFGRGGEYEGLMIRPYRERGSMAFTIGDMLPLALLQGPLGFRVIEVNDHLTVLKRDSPFV